MPVDARNKPRFRLRTILLIVHLFVLVVPLGSIYFFRLYENELVRQTEAELIAQGAYISALYKQTIAPLVHNIPAYGASLTAPTKRIDEKYTVIPVTLDLASATVRPARPDGTMGIPPDPKALEAGKIIFPVLEAATLTTLAGVRVTDYRGIVVAGREEVGLSLADTEEVAAALKGRYMATLRERRNKHSEFPLASLGRSNDTRLFVAMPIVQNERLAGTVLLSRSPRNILKGLYDNRHSVFLAGGIILGIVIMLALLTSYAISRPIHALIEQTRRVARGEKKIQSIKEPVTQELALLSQNISTMAHTIAERSDYIRNFAMHVSHEFKTPLTAIQGAIELIEEHGNAMPPEQQRKFLGNIGKDTARLTQLVSRLLDLARADVMQGRNGSCSLADLLTALQSDHPAIRIKIAGETAISLPLPIDMARSIIGSLIDNSRQHSATEVTLSSKRSPRGLALSVHDNGSGISSANARQLFIPFFTTKREHGGTGLGLAIVQALLRAHHADIHHEAGTHGACFVLFFPTLGLENDEEVEPLS